MINTVKSAHTRGLKIPVSAVRFRLWAPTNSGKSDAAGIVPGPSSAPSTPRSVARVPAGCQRWLAAGGARRRLRSWISRTWFGVCFFVAGLLPGCLTGCASPLTEIDSRDFVYHADVTFTSDERREILIAAGKLSDHTGQPIEIVFDGASAERMIIRDADGSGGCNDMHNDVRNRVRTGTQKIHVGLGSTGYMPSRSTSAQDVADIVAHELAHGLGMDHVEDPQALMAPVWAPGGFKWTADDALEMERARAKGWIWQVK